MVLIKVTDHRTLANGGCLAVGDLGSGLKELCQLDRFEDDIGLPVVEGLAELEADLSVG